MRTQAEPDFTVYRLDENDEPVCIGMAVVSRIADGAVVIEVVLWPGIAPNTNMTIIPSKKH